MAAVKEVFKLPALPWAENALEPYTSARTIQFHYGKHHATYVTKLNAAISGSAFEQASLEHVIVESYKAGNKPVFNNSAQVWNHTFFWNCMRPGGGGKPDEHKHGDLVRQINKDFGSFDKFMESFKTTATNQFGSGWGWLVLDKGVLKITSTKDAESPLVTGGSPLLTVDVWEHAYYLDYQNRRPDFLTAFTDHLLNWDFVAANFAHAGASKM